MPSSYFTKTRLTAIATAVPQRVVPIQDSAGVFGLDAVTKIAESTGVMRRRVSDVLCTSDLAYAAAQQLLLERGMAADAVDALIFVSQTPDYALPATACLLQHRLGANKACAAFDVNQGCSGYVYGLWLAFSLVESGAAKTVLLLVGDTGGRYPSPEDRSTALLFGDAATASLIERDEVAPPAHFVLGTDGAGGGNLVVPAGGCRIKPSQANNFRKVRADGNLRADSDLYMNGAEIFAFTLREVPKMVNQTLAQAQWQKDEVSAFVMHQANQFMLKHLAKRMGIPFDRVPLSISDLGNTSSASVPATITHSLRSQLADGCAHKLLLAGFGVGYSWAAAALTLQNPILPLLIEVPDTAAAAPLLEASA